jgi:gluconolactonase
MPSIRAFEKYWLKLSAVERLTTGLRWAEGPVWFGDGRYLLCSDIPNQRILKWEEETGAVSIFRKPSNFANGNTRDRQGRSSPASMAAAASPAPNMTDRSRC